jgi:hypothetical protein
VRLNKSALLPLTTVSSDGLAGSVPAKRNRRFIALAKNSSVPFQGWLLATRLAFIAAIHHSDWIQNELPHEFGKGPSGHADNDLLGDRCSTTRVAELRTRNNIDNNRLIVRWRYASQDLRYRGPWSRSRLVS